MRVLLIKTSSMGDIIHTLPALTDAGLAIPNIKFDWMVEKNFASIPTWHQQVENVIPVALRRWRKEVFARRTFAEIKKVRSRLREQKYDLILDAQGLVKSAFLTFLTPGVRAGLDRKSAREALASFAYQKKYTVNFHQHAVVRMRALFGAALGYEVPNTLPNFNLQNQTAHSTEKYLVFLFGTTWASKQWPEKYWRRLAEMAQLANYKIKLSGNNADELAAAARIAEGYVNVEVLPRLTIAEMMQLLAQATAAVAVDTGFGHLAAALDVPTVSIYGATNANFTGALGKYSTQLSADFQCAPCLRRVCNYSGKTEIEPACYMTVAPERVWGALQALLRDSNNN